MRTENTKKVTEEKAALEKQRWLESRVNKQEQETMLAGEKLTTTTKSRNDILTALIQQEYARTNKPNDVFKNGKEVLDGVAQRSFLLQQKRFQDTDEVLRKSGKGEDTRRFVQLAFAPSSEQTAQLVNLLQRMSAQWSSEKDQLSSSSDYAADTRDTDTLERVAWMQVLEQLSDEEVRLLWEANVLDVETLASLFSEQSEKERRPENDVSEDVAEDSTSFTPSNSLLVEKIDYVQRLQYLQELTKFICETEIGKVPSIDLAPILVKVQRRQFVDITEDELRKLEQNEESASMRLSASMDKPQASPPDASVQHPTLPTKASIQIEVPASTLDRALTPSNAFLSAVAEKDAALKKSLEGMERIKREALLDPEFQEAVRFAHAVEEASVAPHLHGLATRSDSLAQTDEKDAKDDKSAFRNDARQVMTKRERRAARNRQLRGPMTRSPYSAEVVPYFYNDMRSIVPPRGAFNLPAPTPTKAERAELRGRRRRARQRFRFRK
ncbi:putative mitochondrial hypothetical protein [Leptomonas pyrrhocoris]|uniref:Uncharacterized protein n=1 Tax=Leptomonas pyrrhocoris TaxID=157538 RepID=A0A0N0E032_LEPPY|nr:putative mitochondrial hypothetical protein [Leptomonas pyrrhocoris]KPA85962.1 putative mitochondrial hypothetical protein [Leptomonas pyrrhocoris]|eukprot:XP_015664401.1 putative mitochondrial hypothetical protein [Leptomonas pyrrhocoris]